MSTTQLTSISETVRFASAAIADYTWYAIQIRTRFEKKVAAQLQRAGIEIFLPLIKQVHRWSDRRQIVDVPPFPGYGFVHFYLNPVSRLRVLRTAGLLSFVEFNGEPAPIPKKQIEDLQQILNRNITCAMYPFLNTGQKVRIRGGCLEGLEGRLVDRSSNKTLLISIDAIERTIAIQVERYDIEIL